MRRFVLAILLVLALSGPCWAGWVVSWTVNEYVPAPCPSAEPYWDKYLQKMVVPAQVTLLACFETTERRVGKEFATKGEAEAFIEEAKARPYGWDTVLSDFELTYHE